MPESLQAFRRDGISGKIQGSPIAVFIVATLKYSLPLVLQPIDEEK
ncbi:hypothetical protein [uncultured Nitrosomonas sp.]|nr:hypothetical protein [uncultured Nitrosomonas sp.]